MDSAEELLKEQRKSDGADTKGLIDLKVDPDLDDTTDAESVVSAVKKKQRQDLQTLVVKKRQRQSQNASLNVNCVILTERQVAVH